MKYISFAIPCYNSEGYMRHCIESLLEGGEQVEILIIDDGSKKDRTSSGKNSHPGSTWSLHREGVVDSDDWVDKDAYMQVLRVLEEFVYGDETLDMLISNVIHIERVLRQL